ncbi:hypothetical protein A9Q84_00875 [Halobacteriovorax marinus]|uniref:RNA polymerase sigma factor n=1 Tax=Halobacteriovorax marinus TaxID=97084 RepID=A0A1Y5FHC6_9BACT|nr:hypothetical protein A9Q84_00875 [Halobacteriovorax marinus]
MKDIKQIFIGAREGRNDCVQFLIEIYQPRLLKFCFFLTGDYNLAQDISQETFLKMLKNLHSIKSEKAIYSWLITVARNNFLDIKKSKFNSLEELPLNSLVDRNNHDLELLHDLAYAFSQLEVKDRLVLLVVDFEKLSYIESAQFLDISENALKLRLHRARKKLLSILDETNPYSESS